MESDTLLSESQKDGLIRLGTDIAMHAATNGSRPRFVDARDIDESVLDREKKVQMDLAMAEAEDASVDAEKLLKKVEGRMKKYIADVCLNEQTYCLADDAASNVAISKLVRNTSKSIGVEACRIEKFDVFALGEASE